MRAPAALFVFRLAVKGVLLKNSAKITIENIYQKNTISINNKKVKRSLMYCIKFIIAVFVFFNFSAPLRAGSASDMSFKAVTTGGNCLTCTFVRADGVITSDTPKLFIEFLEKSELPKESGIDIHLNSPGGNLEAGVMLGLIFRELGVSTIVSKSLIKEKYKGFEIHQIDNSFDGKDAICASACSFAFAGGVERYADPNVDPVFVGFQKIGRIGVHQFYDSIAMQNPDREIFSGKDRIEDQRYISLLLSFLKEMGVSADMLQLASNTSPSEIHWMTVDELNSSGMDNASFAIASIEAYKNGVAIVEFNFQRMDAAIRNEIWCHNGQFQMLSTLRWRGGATFKPGDDWHLYENMKIGPSGPNVRLTKQETFWEGDTEVVKMTFSIIGESLQQIVNLRHFDFWDGNSRYSTMAAHQLSFSLPKDFYGMYILPRTCQ